MSMQKLQRLVELDANRAELETQLAAVITEMAEIVGQGFKIAGAKITPVKRGVGALKVPHATPALLGPGTLTAAAPANEDRRATKERVFEHLGGCGDEGASIPSIMSALGLRAGQVTSACLELKDLRRIRRVSRGVYASLK